MRFRVNASYTQTFLYFVFFITLKALNSYRMGTQRSKATHVIVSHVVLSRYDCFDNSTCTSFHKRQLEYVNCFAHVSRIDLGQDPTSTIIQTQVSKDIK